MHVRLCDTAPSQPAEARWLHVLQGADAGAAADEPQLIAGRGGPRGGFDGVVVHGTATLFPQSVYGRFDSLTYSVPLSTQRQLIVGLSPNTNFTARLTRKASAIDVLITHGGPQHSDAGGVLTF
jgi:hypothetical protein